MSLKIPPQYITILSVVNRQKEELLLNSFLILQIYSANFLILVTVVTKLY